MALGSNPGDVCAFTGPENNNNATEKNDAGMKEKAKARKVRMILLYVEPLCSLASGRFSTGVLVPKYVGEARRGTKQSY